jgi:hypothetical protein
VAALATAHELVRLGAELRWYGQAFDIITCAVRCTLPEVASVKIGKRERITNAS